MKLAGALVGAIGAYFAALPFVQSLLPSEKARALGGPVDVDLTSLRPGQSRTYIYRGRPMIVLRRTPEMLAAIELTEQRVLDTETADDPDYVSTKTRSIEPEYLVVEGICTHLGCIPRQTAATDGQAMIGDWWRGGFVCPCHVSGYDYAGRVIKGPAPRNLPIPRHRFVGATQLIIGEDDETSA